MITANANSVVQKWTRSEFIDACNEFGDSWAKAFSVEWSGGGNHCDCWGGDYRIDEEDEKELDLLYSFLEKYFPHLTYLQVRTIERSFDEDTRYDSDYYGGCEMIKYKQMTYDSLLDHLVGFGVLEIINA